MYPTATRRGLIQNLAHGIDVDEQQYDAEHRSYMHDLVVRLAIDVGVMPGELAVPASSSTEPKVSVPVGHPFGDFFDAYTRTARVFEQEIVAAGCAPGSAANIALATAAGVALGNYPPFQRTMGNLVIINLRKEPDHG